jgi:hypothetical protein
MTRQSFLKTITLCAAALLAGIPAMKARAKKWVHIYPEDWRSVELAAAKWWGFTFAEWSDLRFVQRNALARIYLKHGRGLSDATIAELGLLAHPLRAGPGIGFGYDEETRRWWFGDCVFCQGEFDATCCRAQLVAEGRADEYLVIANDVPLNKMPLWLDEYRTTAPRATGKTEFCRRWMKIWGFKC